MSSECYKSPDGIITLVVSREDGDIIIGFDGFAWHTHGDLLAATFAFAGDTGLTPESAAQRFVQDVITNCVIIALSRVGSAIQDAWVTDDCEVERRYQQPGEQLEFRYWDGTPAA